MNYEVSVVVLEDPDGESVLLENVHSAITTESGISVSRVGNPDIELYEDHQMLDVYNEGDRSLAEDRYDL